MRTQEAILDLIIEFAKMDPNIQAVTMNGSRVNKNSICDEYSDFDIQYIVNDIERYIIDKKWIGFFGDPLITQEPEDWFSHEYNHESKNQYPFLIQFHDGNRIDLTFVHRDKLSQFNAEIEPRKILLNKNSELLIDEISETSSFDIAKPSAKEFSNIVNEFLWLSLYVLKGIRRNEIPYAKEFFDRYEIDLLCKVVSWKIGIRNGFGTSLGKSYKYLKNYLSEDEMARFTGIYPNGTAADIYKKLLDMMDLFQETAVYVAQNLNFELDNDQITNIRKYIGKDLTSRST